MLLYTNMFSFLSKFISHKPPTVAGILCFSTSWRAKADFAPQARNKSSGSRLLVDWMGQLSFTFFSWYTSAHCPRCQIGCSCSKNLPCSNYRKIICSCSYYMEHSGNTFFVEEKRIGHRKRKKIFGKGNWFFWNTEKKWAKQLQYFMGVGGGYVIM